MGDDDFQYPRVFTHTYRGNRDGLPKITAEDARQSPPGVCDRTLPFADAAGMGSWNWHCTRAEGHPHPLHVACDSGAGVVVARWYDEQDGPYVILEEEW